MKSRLQIYVRGAVQGVGFRPFIYKLAHEYNLKGVVYNSPMGVYIEVEGNEELIDDFVLKIETRKPDRARITGIEYSKLDMAGQINWILQKKLENHPLKEKQIRLENMITGGVQFFIGGEIYEFIDEIPYPDVKALIEEARSEWEKKSTPGL